MYCKPCRIVAGTDAEDEDDKDCKEDEDGPSSSSLEAILRDARYQLQVTLMASSRGLRAGHRFKVKGLFFIFGKIETNKNLMAT